MISLSFHDYYCVFSDGRHLGLAHEVDPDEEKQEVLARESRHQQSFRILERKSPVKLIVNGDLEQGSCALRYGLKPKTIMVAVRFSLQ